MMMHQTKNYIKWHAEERTPNGKRINTELKFEISKLIKIIINKTWSARSEIE